MDINININDKGFNKNQNSISESIINNNDFDVNGGITKINTDDLEPERTDNDTDAIKAGTPPNWLLESINDVNEVSNPNIKAEDAGTPNI